MKIKFTIGLLIAIVVGIGLSDRTGVAAGSKDPPKAIEVECPGYIAVGPTYLQQGWESSSVFPVNFLSLEIAFVAEYSRQHKVVCWYGDGKHTLTLNYKVPAGYSCHPSETNKHTAVCKVLWK